MSSLLLRVPHHPLRWLQLLAFQQLLLGAAAWSGDPLVWTIAGFALLPVFAYRRSPPEHRLCLHLEERAVTLGSQHLSLQGASRVRVSLGLLGQLTVDDDFSRPLLSLGGLHLPHAKWAARQLAEHFRLPLDSMEDTAGAPRAPFTDGFLERSLEVPILRDLLARIAPACALFALWVSLAGGRPWALIAGAVYALLALALGMVGAKSRHRLRLTADRVESVSQGLFGVPQTTVLRAEDLLPAHVLPGLGAVPTLILADRHGQRIDLVGIDREVLLEVAYSIEQMRALAHAIPEPQPEPPELRRLRAGLHQEP